MVDYRIVPTYNVRRLGYFKMMTHFLHREPKSEGQISEKILRQTQKYLTENIPDSNVGLLKSRTAVQSHIQFARNLGIISPYGGSYTVGPIGSLLNRITSKDESLDIGFAERLFWGYLLFEKDGDMFVHTLQFMYDQERRGEKFVVSRCSERYHNDCHQRVSRLIGRPDLNGPTISMMHEHKVQLRTGKRKPYYTISPRIHWLKDLHLLRTDHQGVHINNSGRLLLDKVPVDVGFMSGTERDVLAINRNWLIHDVFTSLAHGYSFDPRGNKNLEYYPKWSEKDPKRQNEVGLEILNRLFYPYPEVPDARLKFRGDLSVLFFSIIALSEYGIAVDKWDFGTWMASRPSDEKNGFVFRDSARKNESYILRQPFMRRRV